MDHTTPKGEPSTAFHLSQQKSQSPENCPKTPRIPHHHQAPPQFTLLLLSPSSLYSSHICAFVPEDSKCPQGLCIRCSLPESLPPVTYPVSVPTLFRLIPKYHLCQDSFHDQCMWNNPYSIILFSFLQRSFINSYIICLFVFHMPSSHCNISSTGQQCGPFYSLLYLELCLQCHNLSINVY